MLHTNLQSIAVAVLLIMEVILHSPCFAVMWLGLCVVIYSCLKSQGASYATVEHILAFVSFI